MMEEKGRKEEVERGQPAWKINPTKPSNPVSLSTFPQRQVRPERGRAEACFRSWQRMEFKWGSRTLAFGVVRHITQTVWGKAEGRRFRRKQEVSMGQMENLGLRFLRLREMQEILQTCLLCIVMQSAVAGRATAVTARTATHPEQPDRRPESCGAPSAAILARYSAQRTEALQGPPAL